MYPYVNIHSITFHLQYAILPFVVEPLLHNIYKIYFFELFLILCVLIHRLFICFAYMHQHFDENFIGEGSLSADKFSNGYFPPLCMHVKINQSPVFTHFLYLEFHRLYSTYADETGRKIHKLLFYHLQLDVSRFKTFFFSFFERF